MDDRTKVALLEGTLKEILRINEEAGKGCNPGSMPFECALEGKLFYEWLDIREKAKNLLKGNVR